MRIAALETYYNEFICFVKVITDDGAYGWGQVAPYHADITSLILHRQVAPHVLGQDATDIEALVTLVREREHKFPGSHLYRAIGGLDTALWDLRGRLEGLPVCALLGGTPGTVRAYASSMQREILPIEEARRLEQQARDKGFDAFKFRIGSEYGHDEDEWPGRTEEIVPLIRQTLGPDVSLLVDANSCYSPARAIETGHLLMSENIEHFEEPCTYWEYEQTRQVTAALSINVAGGEQDCELGGWQRMIDDHVVDIIQPDICYLGGMQRTLQVAAMADKASMPCTPHCANLSMVTLFTMHLLRVIPNAGKYLEFSIEGLDYYPWQEALFTETPYDIVDGQATVTDRPGWGAEPAPAWLKKARRQVSELPGS